MGISVRASSLKKALSTDGQVIPVLSGVDLDVKEGETVAILGASGCGKTTLLGLLCGLDAPDAGEVYLGGLEIGGLSSDNVATIRHREVGVVYQFFNLIPTLTALENVELPLRLAKPKVPGDPTERATSLLEAVGLSGRLRHRPNQLSGGEQQRVAIARSLVNEPSLILADEPTGNLDSHSAQDILELLAGIRAQRDVTMIVVTHDPAVASGADRILRMKDGKIIGESTIERPADLEGMKKAVQR